MFLHFVTYLTDTLARTMDKKIEDAVAARMSGKAPDTAPKEQFKETLAAQTPEKVPATVPGISDSDTGSPESVAETPDSNSFYGV